MPRDYADCATTADLALYLGLHARGEGGEGLGLNGSTVTPQRNFGHKAKVIIKAVKFYNPTSLVCTVVVLVWLHKLITKIGDLVQLCY